MERRRLSGILAACLTALASACGPEALPAAPTAPPTAAELAGTWRLLSMQTTGGPLEATPDAATYTVSFGERGAGLRVDCNVCNGEVTRTETLMRLGPFVCTLAACPTIAFANRYLQVLEGDQTATLRGDTLHLTSIRGTLRLAR